MIDFNQIAKVNSLLKQKGYEYSIHAIGGCSCKGVQLKQDGKPADKDEIIALINEVLYPSWQKAVPSKEDPDYLLIKHKMDLL